MTNNNCKQKEWLNMDYKKRLDKLKSMNIKDIKAVGVCFGIKPSTLKGSREDIIHKVSSIIANIRGYDLIRGGK